MGTDWVQLFNKRLCDEIVGLNTNTLPSFVEQQIAVLDEFSLFRWNFESLPIEARVGQLLESGETQSSLKATLVDDLCFSKQKVLVDYWGCYVEVFGGVDPPGSIADYAFLERREQRFLLLLPNHADQILRSLEAHRADLTVMSEAEITVLHEWRQICAAYPERMLAYVLDV